MSTLTLTDQGLDSLFGIHDENLRRIEAAFGVRLRARGTAVDVEGEDAAAVATVERMLVELSVLLERGQRFRAHEIQTAIRVLTEDSSVSLLDFFAADFLSEAVRRQVAPRSLAQYRYLRSMVDHDVVISSGPAGTGKTYLAVAMAASWLLEKKVRRIVLSRPAVEAGEKLGFLPGDLAEKVNPYLRPLYDALYDVLGFERVAKLIERNVIEVAPLAFMRGRTLNESFILLDEAQNTTSEQMKMLLTRIGYGSKAVINGDLTQIDLPRGIRGSGLREAEQVLAGIHGIGFVRFTERDVVRHTLVRQIVKAYEAHENAKQALAEVDAP